MTSPQSDINMERIISWSGIRGFNGMETQSFGGALVWFLFGGSLASESLFGLNGHDGDESSKKKVGD